MRGNEQACRILLMTPPDTPARDRAGQLALAGWNVIEVGDEIEAFSTLRNGRADLVVLCLPIRDTVDMDLPVVLRSVADDAYVPIMVLSSDLVERQMCGLLDGGADDVLSADASGPEIIARVGALLRVKELHDQLAASREALRQALQRERKLMSKLRRDNAELRDLAATDPLTHVHNVRALHDLLAHEFRGAKRYDRPLSVLMLDLDHFKVVNDTHGHPSGDYVLKELAVILRRSVRESDVVARTGGEEFAVVLPRADRSRARRFAERIRRDICERSFIVHAQHIHVTASLGTATFPTDAEITDPEMLLYCADQALLEAKESGRDRVVGFGELRAASRRRVRTQYVGAPAD
ncbi:MAG: GGDEF domain-containing protein [Planctomycetota bacterium]